jgi:hypothetical protein
LGTYFLEEGGLFLESAVETRVVFAEETVSEAKEDIKRLMHGHWAEIAHYKDIPLEPDYETYEKIEVFKKLRVFTIRKDAELIGYAIFFLNPAPHYVSSMQAIQNVLYLHPDYRRGGTGGRFIKWCDAQLKLANVQVVMHHVKAAHNFGPLLERMGYELTDHLYAKRLDKWE